MLKTIRFKNFRKYKEFDLDLDPSLTVLIGNNATGKTSILDGISKLLNEYCRHFDNSQKIVDNRSTIKESDIRDEFYQNSVEKQFPLSLFCHSDIQNTYTDWSIVVDGDTDTAKINNNSYKSSLFKIIQDIRNTVKNGTYIQLPLIAYYGTGRLNPASESVAYEKIGSRLDGYLNSLEPNINRQSFMSLFKTLSHDYVVSMEDNKAFPTELQAIKNAIKICIPECEDFSFSARYDTILIKYSNGKIERFSSLSDGYRNIIFMVADIAYRAVKLNGYLGLDAVTKSQGVVLIDEIDQHLHPRWQTRVLDDLKKAFPNIQFIVTTHSPFIIQSINNGILYDLDTDKVTSRDEYLNKSIEDITEDIQFLHLPQKSKRFKDMRKAAKEYFTLLKNNPDNMELTDLKNRLDELLLPFNDNPAYSAFLMLKREEADLRDN